MINNYVKKSPFGAVLPKGLYKSVLLFLLIRVIQPPYVHHHTHFHLATTNCISQIMIHLFNLYSKKKPLQLQGLLVFVLYNFSNNNALGVIAIITHHTAHCLLIF